MQSKAFAEARAALTAPLDRQAQLVMPLSLYGHGFVPAILFTRESDQPTLLSEFKATALERFARIDHVPSDTNPPFQGASVHQTFKMVSSSRLSEHRPSFACTTVRAITCFTYQVPITTLPANCSPHGNPHFRDCDTSQCLQSS